MTRSEMQAWLMSQGWVLGKRLGSGASRRVYMIRRKGTSCWTHVAKLDTSGYWANVTEWSVWREIQWVPEHRNWFAPCEAISSCGAVLIQQRCDPWHDRCMSRTFGRAVHKAYPWLMDLHEHNVGFLGGSMVVFDYASVSYMAIAK